MRSVPSHSAKNLGTFKAERKRLAPVYQPDESLAKALLSLFALAAFIACVSLYLGAL